MFAVRRSRDEITIVHQVVLAAVPLEQVGRRVCEMSGKTTLSHQQRYSTKQHRIMIKSRKKDNALFYAHYAKNTTLACDPK